MTWSTGFAFLSAAIWIVAALIPIQNNVWILARAGGGGPSPELEAVLRRLRLQSYLNAAAAFCAAVAVCLEIK